MEIDEYISKVNFVSIISKILIKAYLQYLYVQR